MRRLISLVFATLLVSPTAVHAIQESPDMDAICAETPCRESSQIDWPLGEDDVWTQTIARMPYQFEDGAVLFSGEFVLLRLVPSEDGFDATVIDGGPIALDARREQFLRLTSQNLTERTEGWSDDQIDATGLPVSSDDPMAEFMAPFPDLGVDEVRIEAFAIQTGTGWNTVYRIDNGLVVPVAFVMGVGGPGTDRINVVSSCSVLPALPSVEHFPYLAPVGVLILFRPTDGEGQACGYWDRTGSAPVGH